MKLLLIPLLLAIAACSSNKPAPVVEAPPKPVEVELDTDKYMRPMTRNEVIMAINECEANNTRAVVINSRRKVNGYSTEVVVDVSCAPKYRF
jgi:hypothetical protein